jgi:DNA-binding SARP family transcriptional activator
MIERYRMSTVRISLFRQFCVQRQKQPLPGLESQKAQELLAYLLLYRQRPFTREQLASLLWPDSPAAQARQYLRQNLWQLQSAVGGNGQSPPNALISVEGEWIQASLASGAWLDVAEFENAYALVKGVPGKALNQNTAHQLQRAVELYRGDLLEEWYYDWCLFERERLQNIYFAVLDKLIAYCEATQAYEAGMAYGSEILRRDRARERTYRWLMRLCWLAGDRTRALRYFQRCEEVLREELGVTPSQQTRSLYWKIQRDQPLDMGMITNHSGSLSEPATGTAPHFLEGLMRLSQALRHVQRQVDDEIRMIREVVTGPCEDGTFR